jgi:hypothetical protein
LAARVLRGRHAPVWYVRSGTGNHTRDIYFASRSRIR